MPGVTKKIKQKAVTKASPAKVEKKFISDSVSFTKNPACKQNHFNEHVFSLKVAKQKAEKGI
jgi:hypothetical protein